jgi:hypothetical protein
MSARLATALLMIGLLGTSWALGQASGAPVIENYRVFVNGQKVLDSASNPGAVVQTEEDDSVSIEIDVQVPGQTTGQGDGQLPDLYYGKVSWWIPYDGFWAPEGPPVEDDTAETTLEPVSPLPIGADTYRVTIGPFRMPEINGANQARLRGLISYDVAYEVSVLVWNSATVTDTTAAPGFWFETWLLDNPALRPRHPAVFADAGADATAELGQTVYLDARQSFDAYNVGFDPLDPQVFDKDVVSFSWEWLSGPKRLDPVFVDPSRQPWLAKIVPDMVGTYRFRVCASTQDSPIPQSDTVTVTVVEELPENHAPVAAISALADPIVEGQIVTLDGSASRDPDGDTLRYWWSQTDEVGQSIEPALLQTVFQPLGGMNEAQSEWQAVRSGTYYFMLLVSDGQYTSSATTSVTVIPAASAGESVTRDTTADGDRGAPLATLPGGCGAGLSPLLLAPLALLLLRGRLR